MRGWPAAVLYYYAAWSACRGLKWDLHPPTVYHFVHALLPFLCDETGLLAKYAEHVAVAQALCGSPPPPAPLIPTTGLSQITTGEPATHGIARLLCATKFVPRLL